MSGPATERKDEKATGARVTMLEARDSLTEIVEKALGGDPQIITRYGRDSVVLISTKEYDRLRALEPSAG